MDRKNMSAENDLFEISVVIISNSRKEYVLDAFKSVLMQDFDRDSYEIIVVKGYEDETVDEFLKKNDAKIILEEGDKLGIKIASGIASAKGRIISLMDDDDQWVINKLSEVHSTFLDPKVVYYNNSQIFVDSNLQPLDQGMIPIEVRNIQIIKQLRISNRSNMADLGLVYRTYGDFNSSSISIRRSFIKNFIEFIQSTSGALDSLLFYLCLSSGKDLIVDNKRLTIYMKHIGNITGRHSTTRKGNNPFSVRQWKGFGDIVKHISSIGDTITLKIIKPVYFGLGIVAQVESNAFSRRGMLKLVLPYLINCNRYILLARKDFLFYGVLGTISPRFCKKIYYDRHKLNK